jgi:hypothetical protein
MKATRLNVYGLVIVLLIIKLSIKQSHSEQGHQSGLATAAVINRRKMAVTKRA